MANLQLVDYVKQQVQLGVSKDAIKSVLAQAGWPEAEINDAFGVASPAPASQVSSPAAPATPSAPAQPAVSSGVGAMGMSKPSSSSPAEISQFAQKPAVATQSPFVTKDIFQPKSEAVFQPKIQPMTAVAGDAKAGGSGAKKYVLLAVWSIVILALLGAAGYFFWENRNLKAQVSGLPEIKAIKASLEQANAEIGSLTAEKNDLIAKFNNANSELANLELHLSFFIAASGGAATTQGIEINGIVGGGKNLYTLTTKRQVVLSVKNSSDSDVSKALLPLVGSEAVISGDHVPGTREITVRAVNGMPVKAAPAVPAAPASTTP